MKPPSSMSTAVADIKVLIIFLSKGMIYVFVVLSAFNYGIPPRKKQSMYRSRVGLDEINNAYGIVKAEL